MRKIYLLLMAMVCIASGSMAQINIANYSFNSSTGNTYTPITGGTVLATTGYDNTVSTAITMGGTFPFGGTNQTTCYISSNGFITFGAAPSATTYTPMSTIGTTTGAIAAFGQDAGTDAVASPNAEIRYQNLGTEFVVQYKDHANYYNRTTEKLNFQIRLTYATGAINIIYGTCTNPGTVSTTGTTPQVGIRGNSVTFSTNVNNLYLKDVPTGTTCNWADAVNGFSNASNLLFSGTTNVNVNIPSGLQYTWTPGTQAPVRAIAAPTSITSSGATVSWTAPTGATTYNVQYRIPGTCAWTNWSGNPVSATTLNLTGLASNTTYQVRIQAVNGAAVSTYSFINGTTATSDGYTTTGTFTTLPSACSGTPTAGTHPVTLFNLCPTSTASLTVAGQTTGVTGLTYQWEQADDAAFTTNVQNAVGGTGATTLSYTTPAYTSGTLYYRLKITCINGGSSATTATPVQVTGPVAPTTQASAIVIPAATLLNTSATINWTNGSGGRRFVVVNTTNSFTDPVGNSDVTGVSSVYAGGEQKVYDGTASTISVTGLTAGTTYYVRVYEYLRCTGTPNTNYYNITTATGNPNSFTTTTPPANDDCATSINLTPQNYVALPTCPSGVSGTTVGANTSSVTTPPSIDFFTSQDDDVWYDFVATNTTHYVRLCNVTYPIGAVVNMGLVVTNGCTGTSVETISTPTLSTVTIAASGGSGELAYTGLTIGTTYKIRVLTSGTTSRANFQISVLNPQPMTYVSSTTTQSSTATVTAGSTTQQIVRLEVTVIGGASPLSISQIDFNTNGTTSGAATTDIANAKVYYTGTSTTFATTTQFGSTVSAPNGIFNVSGTPQVLTGGLTNTVNYFWLVYDIPCTANVSDVVDAECTGFNIGSVQIPTVTAPAGTRAITALYAPTRTDGNSTTAIIQGTTNAPFVYTNISGSAACPGNITNVDFTVSGTAPATDILQAKCYYTTTSTFATTTPFGTAIANPAAGTISFTGTQALATGTGNYFWLVYDVSCTATPTNTLNGDVSAIYLNGSVTPVAAITGTATAANAITALYVPTRTDGNSTTAIIQGTTNAPFVYTNISGSAACPGNITKVDFTVSGTAPTTDILQAKCYYTTTSTFATTTPFGTAIANPAAGTISFTGTQALAAGTGNYFWLVYDVSCTATPTNTLNGDVSAIYLNGSVTPVAAITGTATTANAISTLYSPTRTDGNSTTAIIQGTTNAPFVYTNISGSAACPGNITKVDFTVSGTAPATDILQAKCYYTTTSTFATTTPFGTAIANPAAGTISFTGTQALATGTGNYFWLVYDVSCTATPTNTLNGDVSAIYLNGSVTPVAAITGTATSANAITALYAPTRTDGNSTTAVTAGTTFAPFVYTNISGSAACPGNITKVDFTVSGTAPATDILQAKCYYTTTSTFATTTPFGTAIANPAAGTISFTGTQALVAGTGNYFWLVYDVSCTATPTNTLNGDVSAIYLNGSVTPVAAITGTATTANAISASTGYSTINDGDWNSPSTWACGTVPPPPACNSTATIIINNNITVTTSGAVGANITVAAGKTLTISGGDLTLGCTSASGGTGGSNKLLTVNGTLTITGGTLNVNGGVAFGGVTSAFNMSGGTLNLDPNDGTAAGSFASTNGGFYLTTGLVNLTGGNINFLDPMYTATSGTGQSVFGYSHSSIDALSTTGCTITFGGGDDQNTLNTNGFYVESNLSTGTFELGNVIIAGGRTAAKRQVTTRQGVTNYITKFKNLTINSGAELLLTSGSAPLSITGNLINNGIFTNEAATASGSGLYFADLQYSAGVVTFPLNTAQSVSGTGFFKKLTADADPTAQTGNTLAGMYLNHLRTSPGVTLNVPLTVTSWLALINGKINTTTSNILALGNGTSLAGYGSGLTETPGTLYGSGFTTYTTAASYVGGWVNGPFNRWYSAATTLGQQGISPVGSDTSRPSQILYTTAPTTAGYLQSQWYDGTGTTSFTNPVINQTGVTPTLINAATNAYWRVEPATVLGVIGGTYTASMNDNNANAVLSFANTVLLKRPTAGGDWEDNGAGAPIGIHIASTGTNTDVTVNRSGLNTFSQFAIGGGLGTLPVAITNVTALITGSTNTVYWTTATEANNRKFVVERSVNGNNFTAIGEVATRAINGNSNTALQYSFVDANPVQGKAFYRLQMVDNNTRATYSQIVTLRRGAGKLEIVDVRPNPTTGTVYFNVLGTSTNVNVAVRDLSGKEVIRKSLVQSNSFSIDMSKLANGMYILEAVDVRSNEKAVFKVVKQ